MKKMILCTIVGCALCGCETDEVAANDGSESRDFISDISVIDAENGQDAVSMMSIEDANFSYVIGGESGPRFKKKNPRATLNDLNDFALAKCWRGYLLPKIENGQGITREDAVMLDFCINVQLNMIDTLAVASLGDMTSPGLLHSFVVDLKEKSGRQSPDLEGVYKDQNDVFTDLKLEFINSGDGIRQPMRMWGNAYQSIPTDVLAGVFRDIEESFGAAKIENASHPWLWTGAYVAGAFLGGAIGTGIVGGIQALSPDGLNEIEKGAMNFSCTPVDTKNSWQGARSQMCTYVPELRKMRNVLDCARVRTTDAQTRKYLQRVLAESENDTTAVSDYLDYAVYDMPFCLQTYKARGALKKCQGFFDDDEDKMKEVMAAYCTAVSGTDMISHIRTRYAANGYAELIKLFKEELSKKDFQNFVQETRLYNVNVKADGKNELKEMRGNE